MKYSYNTRRELFKKSLFLSPFLWKPGLMAETLTLTPRQTEGPLLLFHCS